MSLRIKVGLRVSTNASRCDIPKTDETSRWSYSVFGSAWRDARIISTVLSRTSSKVIVKFDVDGQTAAFETQHLILLPPDTPKQALPTKGGETSFLEIF